MFEFPTAKHQAAAVAATEFLAGLVDVDAVLVVGSAARRGDANDLDLAAVLSSEGQSVELEQWFLTFAQSCSEFEALAELGPFASIDFHTTSGRFAPRSRGWTSGPDEFELEIGNEVAYSVCLWERDGRVTELRRSWLPFYDDALRASRLADARMYAINDLDHIPLMLRRDEPFHAFHRLYHAFQEFLQALFISRRVYPIAYDKWIREQVEGLLGLPELYHELPAIIGIPALASPAIDASAARLRTLLDDWAIT